MKSSEETSTFTLEETQEAVLCANLAYYEPDSKEHINLLKDIKNHGGVTKLKAIPFRKTKSKDNPNALAGHAIAIGEKVVLSYHGTDNVDELQNDLDAVHSDMKLPDGESVSVHRGIESEFFLSNEDRERAVKEAMDVARDGNANKDIPYYCVGHSLGGALATGAALFDVSKAKKEKKAPAPRIITFGAVKFFSHDAAQKYTKYGLANNTLHIQQKYDPVPMLPPQSMDYTHVGHVVEIPTDIDSGIHMLDSAYSHITSGKHQSKTNEAIRKLGAVTKVDDYKPFRVEGYAKSMMSMNHVIFNACMRRRTPVTVAIAGLSIAMRGGIGATNTINSPQQSYVTSNKRPQKYSKF
jgi:hypothetical protein